MSRTRPGGHAATAVRIDVLVLFASLIWGCNYAIVKTALREIPELAFNSLRLGIASILFLCVLAFERAPSSPADSAADAPARRRWFASAGCLTARDWLAVAGLGVVGHFVYQICFLGGLARTTVANSALILSSSPVAVTALSLAAGHEKVSRVYWLGALLSLAGVYCVVGAGAALSARSFAGDVITLIAVACWAVYAVGSRPLMERHSPMAVTGYSMAIGTLLYVPFGMPAMVALDWRAVSAGAWVGLGFSAVFALFVAYLIWYTSIQRVGNVRTAIYSNINPLIALLTAVVFLGDHLTARQIAGAVAILLGVAIARPAVPGSGRTTAQG